MVEQIKSLLGLDFFELQLDPRFASVTANYRENIREHIISTYSTQLSTEEKASIQNLQLLPVAKALFFSISHCKSIGGYAVSFSPIGFDIEEVDRINPAAAARVCHADELDFVTDVRFLWPVKESLVKLNPARKNSTPLMSEFKITSWKPIEENMFRFTSPGVQGVLIKQPSYLLAVAQICVE